MPYWDLISLIIASVIAFIILGTALLIWWKIFTNTIDLEYLIAEANGEASLSRFQFLLFTFVIAGLYLLLCIESGTFVEVPQSVLGLLGISGGSYILSKGIQSSNGGALKGKPAQKPATPTGGKGE